MRATTEAQVTNATARTAVVQCLRAALTITGALAILGALSVMTVSSAAFAAEPPAEASPTLTYATHKEQLGKVQLIANTYLASLRQDQDYIPIPMAVGVEPGGPSFTLRPESFRLIMPNGDEVAPADFKTLRHDYRRLSFDRKVLSIRPMLGGQEFLGHIGVSSNFFPAIGSGVRQATADLSSNTFAADFLYFPMPEEGLDGVFTLRLQADGLGDPVDVRLVLP